MLTPLLALGGVAGALVLVAFVPVRVALAVRGRGTPDGSWALAGGVELLGSSVSFVRSATHPMKLDVRVLGRRFGRDASAAPPSPTPASQSSTPRARASRLRRWFDDEELALFLVDEAGRLGLHDVDASIRLGMQDLALLGQIAGGLAVASALVAPFGRLSYDIDWSGADQLDGSFSCRARVVPGSFACDAARFVLRSLLARLRWRLGLTTRSIALDPGS